MKIEGNFRVFKDVNAGRVNCSLAISVNDENEEFFSELGRKIAIRISIRMCMPEFTQT